MALGWTSAEEPSFESTKRFRFASDLVTPCHAQRARRPAVFSSCRASYCISANKATFTDSNLSAWNCTEELIYGQRKSQQSLHGRRFQMRHRFLLSALMVLIAIAALSL